jgi:integrase
MRLVLDRRSKDDVLLFPRYERDGLIFATHASNAVNKWLKRDYDGLTCHCLRHTMRDRLRAVEAPFELIDQIGGWASVGSVGASYGWGYKVDALRRWLEKIAVAASL